MSVVYDLIDRKPRIFMIPYTRLFPLVIVSMFLATMAGWVAGFILITGGYLALLKIEKLDRLKKRRISYSDDLIGAENRFSEIGGYTAILKKVD